MRIFVAGATGATGQVFVPLATRAGHDLVLHVRPQTAARTPLGTDPRARVFDLDDAPRLHQALSGCDAIVSLVGTMRSRFRAGDTYQKSDIGTTQQLVDGAVAAGVPRLLLLSSLGAGGPGAYLQAKARCEQIVQASPLRWTLFRPGMLVSPPDADPGLHGRRGAPGLTGIFRALARIPGLRDPADDLGPMPIEVLCRAMLQVLATPRDGEVLWGRHLWQLGAPVASP